MRRTIVLLTLVSLTLSLSASHYPDSVQQASKEQERIRKGWNFEFAGGVGMSQLAYQTQGDAAANDHIKNGLGFPAWNANIGIGYYFLPWFGLATGAHFSTYMSNATIEDAWQFDLTDRYGDRYTQTLTPEGIKEKQEVYYVEIPVALKFRAMPEGKKVGFIGTAGAKLGLPIMNRYRLNDAATLKNQVYYPTYDLTMNGDIPTVLEDGVINPYSRSLTTTQISTLNLAGYVELGVLFQVHQRVDIGLSLFANYYFNDLVPSSGRIPLGFNNVLPEGEYESTPLHENPYSSILNTTAVSSVHPWSTGLKLSFQINASRTDAQLEYDRRKRDKKRGIPEEEKEESTATVEVVTVVQTIDSAALWAKHCEENKRMIMYLANECGIDLAELAGAPSAHVAPQTVIIHDTVYIERVVERTIDATATKNAAELLEDELSKAVIFFDFDKSEPKLEPADILVRIAAILKEHPSQKIYVNGHACKLGSDSYNMRLAMRRAKAVAAELKRLGVKDEQMIVQSKGSKEAFRYNGLEHQLSKDRRVEIIPVGLETNTNVNIPSQSVRTTTAANIETTEVVREGSRLSQIARRHYGEPMYWVYIYEANKDVISNPQDIQPGITLRIPDLNTITHGRTREEVLREAAQKAEQYKNMR